MEFALDTGKTPRDLTIEVKTPQPTKVTFVGFDASKPNTYYFAREKTIYGTEKVNFRMPQSPEQLTIRVDKRDNKNGNFVNVVDVKMKNLPSKTVAYDKGVYPFIKFAQSFAAKAGYLGEGFYISNDEKYVIWLKDHLDDSGTPAKVNRRTGIIKVSTQAVKKYTVPMRMFIVLHEFYHWYYKTKSEFKADGGALRTYLQMQYPKSEGNFAMTKIFIDSPMAWKRTEIMDKMFKQYS